MARKQFTPRGQVKRDAQAYRAFADALLSGEITATRMYATRVGGRVRLEYDDPEGASPEKVDRHG